MTDSFPATRRALTEAAQSGAMTKGLIELAERSQHGIDVRLLWHRDGGEVVLQVVDDKSGETYEQEIAPECAMDAFRHPFVYVSSTGARVVASDAPGAAGPAAGIHRAA
jgi:hypothetical protein